MVPQYHPAGRLIVMSIGLDGLAVNPCSGLWLHALCVHLGACSEASNSSSVEGGKTLCLRRGSKMKRDTLHPLGMGRLPL